MTLKDFGFGDVVALVTGVGALAAAIRYVILPFAQGFVLTTGKPEVERLDDRIDGEAAEREALAVRLAEAEKGLAALPTALGGLARSLEVNTAAQQQSTDFMQRLTLELGEVKEQLGEVKGELRALPRLKEP